MAEQLTDAEVVQYLEDVAGHFAYPDGWKWTRDHGLSRIGYADDYTGFNHPLRRIPRAFSSAWRMAMRYFEWNKPSGKRARPNPLGGAVWAWAGFSGQLFAENNLPDGKFEEAAVYCFWEEDGEYIQVMQPSVGKLLAQFLKEEPDNPHAVAITAEMKRILQSYFDSVEE